jgi:hypothetical protein
VKNPSHAHLTGCTHLVAGVLNPGCWASGLSAWALSVKEKEPLVVVFEASSQPSMHKNT